MAGRRLGLLALSAGIHAAIVALAIVAFSREAALAPLFVNLAALEGGRQHGREGRDSGSAPEPGAGRGERPVPLVSGGDVGAGKRVSWEAALRGSRGVDAVLGEWDASAGREPPNRETPQASLEVDLVEDPSAPPAATVAGAAGATGAEVAAQPRAEVGGAASAPRTGAADGAGRFAGGEGEAKRARADHASGAGAVAATGGGHPGGAAGVGAAGSGSRSRAAGGTAGPGGGPGGGGGLLASAGRDAPVPVEYGAYLALFRRRVEEGLHYPLAARRRGLTGTVELEVLIDKGGAVRGVEVVASSSHGALDEAAMDAVRALSPQPFPPGVAPRSLRVRLPLVFDLR